MAVFTNELKLDVGPMLKSLTEAATKAEAAGREIQDGLVQGIKAGSAEAKALSDAFNGVSASANKSVGELKNSIAAMIAAGKGSGDVFDALVNDLKTADAEAKKLKAALQEVDKLTVEVPVDVQPDASNIASQTGKIKGQIADGFKGLGSSITGGIIGGGVASAVQGGAQLIVGAFQSVIEIGSEFQTNIANLQAITGASGPVLDDLSNRARDLAKQFGGDATTQVQSFQTILSKFGPALANTPEALGTFSTNVNILSKAAGLDAKQAVDALSNSMLQFGVDASDPARLAAESGRFINVLAASAKEGAAEIPQVAEAILQSGVAAKGANLSFEETNAAIQALAIGGKVGSEAGVGLRNVLGLLIKQSGPGAKALEGVGLSVEGLGKTLTTQGLSAALKELQGGIEKLGSDSEKAAFKATLFGSENAATAGILLENADAISELTGKITGTQEAYAQAEINMATFSEFVSRAKANIGDFAISLFNAFSDIGSLFGDVLGPSLGAAVEQIGGYFSELFEQVKPILLAIGGAIFAGITVAIQVVAQTFQIVFGIAREVLGAFSDALQPLKDAILGVFGMDGAAGEGVDIMKIFTDALKFVGEILTSVGGIIIEIGGFIVNVLVIPFQLLVGVITTVINKFREWFGSQAESNKEADKGKGIIDRLREAFLNIRGTISGVTAAFQEIKKTIGDFFNALTSFDLKAALNAFSGFGQKVGAAYNKGFNEVQTADQLAKAAEAATAAAQQQTAAVAEPAAKKTGGGSATKAADEAIKKAQELFAIREAILKTEQETATTAILRQGLDKDAEKVALKKLELETQKKLTQEYIKAFGAVTKLNAETGEEQVVSVGFKVDNKQLADINTRVQNFLQQEIRLQAELALKPEELEKTVAKSIKLFEESFKKNAKDLTDGIIDPAQFQTSVEGLRGSFSSLRTSLEEALQTPQVQASPALRAAYEEQILLVRQKLTEMENETIELSDKAYVESQKQRVEINKLNLEALKENEQANAAEILRIARETIAIETDLKLRQLKTTGQLRDAETKAILADAAKQTKELEKKYGATGGTFDSLVSNFSTAIAGLDFTGAFDTLVEAGTEAAEETVAALKAGTLDYQSAVDQLANITVETSSYLETVLQKIADSFAKIKDASIASLRDISTGFDGSKEAIDKLISATANAAAAGFAQILLEGESFGKGFVLLMLDILDATIPALVALILGQSLAANPLVGAVVSAALIATLKAAVAVAKSAAQGFESGGYTGNVGTKDIAGFVHGQEFVINARATKQFRPMLEEMNKGRLPVISERESLRPEIDALRRELSQTIKAVSAIQRERETLKIDVTGNTPQMNIVQQMAISSTPIIDNAEFGAMRNELSAIRRRLDGMPNGIQGSQAVRLDVGFDNYIYERDRRRAALRGLKG